MIGSVANTPNSVAFIDESKRNGFILVASLVPIREVVSARKQMEKLLLPGQSRLHFRKENYSRKQEILRTVNQLPVHHVIVDANEVRNQRIARLRALETVARFCIQEGISQLIIELDESHLTLDRKTLGNLAFSELRYFHTHARHDPGLWIADTAAWCYAHGGSWKHLLNNRSEIVV
jgi:ribosomal protein L20